LAQQTIFNVPSADVTPPGRVYLEHESQFRPWGADRFWLGTHYTAIGVGKNTEIDVDLFNVQSPASDNISLGVGFKSVLPLWKRRWPERELKLTVGSMVPVSLEGHGVGNWTYVHASGRLPRLRTRLTIGAQAGTRQIFARNTAGVIAGVEQPITRRLVLIGDWFSGTHNNGFLITGFSYALTPTTTLYCGYQIPNNPRAGRSGLVFELSKLF
jgi:hypothetical protein